MSEPKLSDSAARELDRVTEQLTRDVLAEAASMAAEVAHGEKLVTAGIVRQAWARFLEESQSDQKNPARESGSGFSLRAAGIALLLVGSAYAAYELAPTGLTRIGASLLLLAAAGLAYVLASQPVAGLLRTARYRSSQWNIDRARRWHRKRPVVTVLEVLSYTGAVVLLAAVAWSLAALIHGNPPVSWKGLNNRCANDSIACAVAGGFVIPLLVAALASAAFFFYQRYYLKSYIVRKIESYSHQLVRTAAPDDTSIVGRDALCEVIMEGIRGRDARRPHVIVGGAGAGKTALLVRLTELLADHGALPIPVLLRDAQENLDFREMAWNRFRSVADGRFLTNGRAHRIWRQLCKDDQVVVVADGLEQALNGDRPRQNHEYLIRLAIRQAEADDLPLVIASRPYDALQDVNATIMELEPLSEEAALGYARRHASSQDRRRIGWIAETAAVAEAPLYLQIIGELERAGLLDAVLADRSGRRVDALSADRPGLRLRILQTWERALVAGHLLPGVALSREERTAAVEQLSALACMGLRRGRRKVSPEEFAVLAKPRSDSEPVSAIARKVAGELARIGQPAFDVPLAAVQGERIQLVEARDKEVWFPQSVLQAYLGSQHITEAMADPGFREEALTNAGPELLAALVMRSRAEAERSSQITGGSGSPRELSWFRELLRESVSERLKDAKAVDMYAALLEIDSVNPAPEHRAIAREIVRDWRKFAEPDPRTLENAKRNLVSQFGQAARTVSQRRHATARPAYRQLFDIGCREQSDPIRLAIVQEIGAGGADALIELEKSPGLGPGFDQKMEQDERKYRRDVMRARLVPLLAEAVTGGKPGEIARESLKEWLDFVCGEDGQTRRAPLPLEIALAQGFKYAANRRAAQVGARHEMRENLAEGALAMLKVTEHWFSQLTLIQALCLLSLSGQPDQPAGQRRAKAKAIVRHWLDVAGRESPGRSQPAALRAEPHPFVREAARLAVAALETGRPQRYLWIDEREVVSRVGSYPARPGPHQRTPSLWIPPSTGWAGLDARAQQLVADVLVLRNLAERGQQPEDTEQRLRRADRSDLPPCLTRDRRPLDPGTTRGGTDAAPGTSCLDGCPFGLCPYPPPGTPRGVEISEAFCRRQQTLLTRSSLGRRKAPWQEMRRRQLVQFWADMAGRAPGPPPRHG